MKVTQVSLMPAPGAQENNRPALTPELLAATGARYSRNNEGLDAILARINWNNLDKSVDSIFSMVDYGHASIADMSPVALFIDDVSLFLAYLIWSLAQTAGGQESSTRFIDMENVRLISAQALGISENQQSGYDATRREMFSLYRQARDAWAELATRRPELMRIPANLINDPSDAARKKMERLKRNFAFDRARVFLPVNARTNLMLIMSARAWAGIASYLASHPLSEAKLVAALIRDEMGLAVPRLMKHAVASEATTVHINSEMDKIVTCVQRLCPGEREPGTRYSEMPTAKIAVMKPFFGNDQAYVDDLKHRTNRYSIVGSALARTSVRYTCAAVAFAELRDMNRHRPGTKYAPLYPVGFYTALDEVPADETGLRDMLLSAEERMAHLAIDPVREAILARDFSYPYWMALGTQVRFEHVNTADKFIYEAELRTGVGAHYRYARHYRDMLNEWYKEMPMTKGLIMEGSAEPE